MDILISFYDSLLIYYPNIFFAALFLLIFLFILLILQTNKYRETSKQLRKIKNYLLILQTNKYRETSKQLRKIKNYRYDLKPRKLTISDYPIILMERFIHKGIRGVESIEMRTEKLIKKIGKEILIDEKT